MFIVKCFFTFGLRKVEPGTIHLIQTTNVPVLIYELPPSSRRSQAEPNLYRRSFEPYDQMLYHRTVMEPHTSYPIPAGTQYILMTVQKTVFALDVLPETILTTLLQNGFRLGDFRKAKHYHQKAYKLPPPTPAHTPVEERPASGKRALAKSYLEVPSRYKKMRIAPATRRIQRPPTPEPATSVFIPPPAPVVVSPPAPVFVSPPAPVFVSPPAPVAVSPPAPVFVSPPAPVFVSPPAPVTVCPPAPVTVSPPAPVMFSPPAPVVVSPAPVFVSPTAPETLAPVVAPPLPEPTLTDNETYNELMDAVFAPVNNRLVYAMRCIGKGAEFAVVSCGIMNLPPPPTKFNNILLQAARETCEESMAEAVEENDGGRDIAVAVDGSDNSVADALSRINALNLSTTDLQHLADSQTKDEELKTLISSNDLSIKLKPLKMGNALEMFCDVSREKIQPYVQEELCFEVFRSLHNLSHPGIRATKRLIQDCSIWPSMLKDITKWTRCCIAYQRSKVQRHPESKVVSPVQPFAPTVERFQHVHVDLVGPFPPSDGFTFLLTCINRYTRWPEVIPLSDISAEAVAKSFIANWISRFGVPAIITTDQGGRIQSHLLDSLKSMLGIQRIRTTPYHPSSPLIAGSRRDSINDSFPGFIVKLLQNYVISS
ncbi:pro-Pol polyprotein [Nephila pilipes]|uniref:RNA-directed DNA polymerase n=1 Tax=Nephila pilipes TaxID=299642 RepID=A0A8X6UUH5_NEPPI|nr:pro-Pol polyprotein [Nephila pilipes]